MFAIPNMTKPNYVPSRARAPYEFGQMFRAERASIGMTQQQVADSVKCRRQTIGDLEEGKNVGLMTVFLALSAIGKTMVIHNNDFDLEELRLFLEAEAE